MKTPSILSLQIILIVSVATTLIPCHAQKISPQEINENSWYSLSTVVQGENQFMSNLEGKLKLSKTENENTFWRFIPTDKDHFKIQCKSTGQFVTTYGSRESQKDVSVGEFGEGAEWRLVPNKDGFTLVNKLTKFSRIVFLKLARNKKIYGLSKV